MKASKRISPDFLYCISRQAKRSLENKMRLPCRSSPGQPPFAYSITDQLSPGDEIIGEHPGLDAQGLSDGLNKRASAPTLPDLPGPDLRPCWMRLVLVQEQDPHPIERAKK